jgi:hypothetical protein
MTLKRTLRRTLGVAAGDGLARTITRLHRDETRLAQAFVDLSDRHAPDHEIHFVARDLATWSYEHVRRLAEKGGSHGLDLRAEPRPELPLTHVVKRAGSELLGRRHAPTALLLADLRHVHERAAGVSLAWEMLAQGAQAAQDSDLLALASDCHPQTLRQLRWTNAQVKELSPQALIG